MIKFKHISIKLVAEFMIILSDGAQDQYVHVFNSDSLIKLTKSHFIFIF
jgi:hypothetical protein